MTQSRSKAPSSHREIIDLWPSIADYASETGIPYETAKQQRRRASIGERHRAQVIDAAKKRGFRGITFELLTRTASRRGEPTLARPQGRAA